MRRRAVKIALAVGLLFLAPSASAKPNPSKDPADDFAADVASVWLDLLYDIVKAEATAPPQASRIYGVVAVALYEAIVPGSLHNRSLVGQLNDLSSIPPPTKNRKLHWPTVANAALARTIRGLFPALAPFNLDAVNTLEADFNAQGAGIRSTHGTSSDP
jgi:hypothetical protein